MNKSIKTFTKLIVLASLFGLVVFFTVAMPVINRLGFGAQPRDFGEADIGAAPFDAEVKFRKWVICHDLQFRFYDFL